MSRKRQHLPTAQVTTLLNYRHTHNILVILTLNETDLDKMRQCKVFFILAILLRSRHKELKNRVHSIIR